MERKQFEHRGAYNPQKPVLIFSKETIGIDTKQITGVVKSGNNTLNAGDVINSNYIGTNATSSMPFTGWEVKEIKERFTPEGHYIVDIENAGFVAIVEPYVENEEN